MPKDFVPKDFITLADWSADELLGMLARSSRADVNVIALIGERGREVREFIERDLGSDGLKRSVVVTVTSDQSPLLRVKGAMGALAIAEAYRDAGLDVCFMMDSVTRCAMAQRELGLAVGEPSDDAEERLQIGRRQAVHGDDAPAGNQAVAARGRAVIEVRDVDAARVDAALRRELAMRLLQQRAGPRERDDVRLHRAGVLHR